MDDAVLEQEPSAATPSLRVVAGLLAVVALAGAPAYLVFREHPARSSIAGSGATELSGQLRLTTPAGPVFSRRYVPLRVRVLGRAHDVRLEFRTKPSNRWSPIPETWLSTDARRGVELPLDTDEHGSTTLVRWDMPATNSAGGGVDPANSVDRDGVVWIRAVATSPGGHRIASAPAVAVLVRRAPEPDEVSAPATESGYVFSGAPPIHVTWSAPARTFALPGGRSISVPLKGYAVDVVNKDDLDSGWTQLPAAFVGSTVTNYDVEVPEHSDHPNVIAIRSIDAAGNVSTPLLTTPFLSQTLVLASPREHAVLQRDAAVPLLALNASTRPVCFEYRPMNPGDPGAFYARIPPGEVTDASGRPITGWPLRITRTGSRLFWHGLRHADGIDGRPGQSVQIHAVRTASTDCEVGFGITQDVTVTWRP
jgi:hypothetical protein